MNLSIQKSFTFRDHDAPVYSLEPYTESTFFSGGGDKLVSIRGLLIDSKSKAIVNTGTTIYSLKYIPQKNTLLTGVSGGGMHVIDLNEKKEIHFLLFHQKGIYDIQYSVMNDLIITCGGDGKIAFWSGKNFSFLKSISLCSEKIRSAVINKSESNVIIGCGDGTIRLIDLKTLEQIHCFSAHQSSVNAVYLHPFKDILISGGRDAHLNFWKTSDFQRINSIPAHNFAIYSIAFSPDNTLFASASRDKTIKIWNANSLEFLFRIDAEKNSGHAYSVNKLCWMKNTLLSASDDRSIIGWEICYV